MSASEDERIGDEIAALEAILMDDVVIKRVDGIPSVIETTIHPSTGDDVDQRFVCVTLEVKLTPGYPDSIPEVTLRNPRGLDDELLTRLNSQIKNKLNDCLGLPVVFELIELIRENLTASNLPSGQCVICLFGFAEGDVFIKTQCYHHFHSHCLADHLINGQKYYQEELEKLPNWQQINAPPYQQTCPVCRCPVTCDVEALKQAPPPVASINEPPFCLTAELRALQHKMSQLLAKQIAKGGVVGIGDTGPPPLTITTPGEDSQEPGCRSSSAGPETNKSEASIEASSKIAGSSAEPSAPASPQQRPAYRGPYRGFNRRGKPGRRGRGGR